MPPNSTTFSSTAKLDRSWDSMGPGDVSQWARNATHEEAEQTHTVVSYGYDLEGVHTRGIGIDCKPSGTELVNKNFKLWLMRYIIDGRAELVANHNPSIAYDVEPGMVVWSSPEVDTTETVVSKEPLRAFTLLLFGQDAPDRFSQAFSSSIGARAVNQPKAVESLFAELFLESQFHNIHRTANCEQLTGILLNRIATHLQLSSSFAGEGRLTFQQAQQYIDHHFADISSVLDIAGHCGITQQYLGRVFKEFTDVSPYQYLTNLRIYHAREMLFATDDSIQAIGRAVGYQDAGLFSKNFIKVVGESPRAHRNQLRGKG